MSSLSDELTNLLIEGNNIAVLSQRGDSGISSIYEAIDNLGLTYKYIISTITPLSDIALFEPGEAGLTEVWIPSDMTEADVLFIDEANKNSSADREILDEILQFKTIHGQPLRNLKAVVTVFYKNEENFQAASEHLTNVTYIDS